MYSIFFLLFEVVFTAFQIQLLKRFNGSAIDVRRQISLALVCDTVVLVYPISYPLLETAEC